MAGGITNPYQPAHAHRMGYLVWSGGGLPSLTIGPFWVHTCRADALPTITTAAKGQGIDVSVAGIRHQVAGWHKVIAVDNVENGRHTQKWAGTMRVGIAKKIFSESGRSASKFTPMVVKLVGQ